MDIFHMNNNAYFSSRYLNFCFIRKLKSEQYCHEYIEEVIRQVYSNAKYLMTDNESVSMGIIAKSITDFKGKKFVPIE